MPAYKDILHAVMESAKAHPDLPLLLATSGERLTRRLFLARACAVAASLRKAGLAPGDYVTIQAEESTAFFPCLIGVWLCGGVAVPVNLRYTRKTLEDIVARLNAPFMLVDGEPAVARPEACVIRYRGLADAAPGALASLPGLAADDLSIIYFTSGTTGLSKGAELSWDAVNRNAFGVADILGLDSGDRIYINTPPYYTSGICHFLTLAVCGGSLVASSGFQFGDDLFAEMEKNRCTGFGGAPAHIVRATQPLDAPIFPKPLRFWVSSGDHLPVSVLSKAQTVLPEVDFYVVYGLSEVAGRLCILRPEEQAGHIGSVGRPLPGMTVTVRDEALRELPFGQQGELFVSGSGLMRGYHNAPELNAASLTAHGFRTGDTGRVDADGFVWVEGRLDDLFKCGGEKVSLQLVQQELLNISGVADAATLAQDDAILGKTVCAFVAPAAGAALTPLQIMKALRGKIPDNHLPKRVVFVDAIPRTGSGKAVKAELRILSGQ